MPRVSLRHRCAALVSTLLVSASVLGATSPARADDSLTRRAAAIVQTVVSGEPLRVVVTHTSADGRPTFETTVASTRDAALALVRTALGQGESVSMAQTASITASNDPGRTRQWSLTRFKIEPLWNITTGGVNRAKHNRQAVVAIVDTGVAPHVDLGRNRLAGRDFVAPGTSATDPNGHGTHVAGIVAALGYNRKGIAGVARRAKVLPVRVLGADGSGTTDVIARGVVYAADQGAQVINMSLASTTSDPALQAAVQYAQRKGALVVAAGGNDGRGPCNFLFGCPTQYPAAYANVVGVGSIDRGGAASDFSSYGSWIDLVAPGGDILSTVPKKQRLGGDCDGHSYCELSGTSMASPHVAAAAALAYSEHGWRGTTLAKKLIATATDLGPSGKDTTYGYGLVNPGALLRQ